MEMGGGKLIFFLLLCTNPRRMWRYHRSLSPCCLYSDAALWGGGSRYIIFWLCSFFLFYLPLYWALVTSALLAPLLAKSWSRLLLATGPAPFVVFRNGERVQAQRAGQREQMNKRERGDGGTLIFFLLLCTNPWRMWRYHLSLSLCCLYSDAAR